MSETAIHLFLVAGPPRHFECYWHYPSPSLAHTVTPATPTPFKNHRESFLLSFISLPPAHHSFFHNAAHHLPKPPPTPTPTISQTRNANCRVFRCPVGADKLPRSQSQSKIGKRRRCLAKGPTKEQDRAEAVTSTRPRFGRLQAPTSWLAGIHERSCFLVGGGNRQAF